MLAVQFVVDNDLRDHRFIWITCGVWIQLGTSLVIRVKETGGGSILGGGKSKNSNSDTKHS